MFIITIIIVTAIYLQFTGCLPMELGKIIIIIWQGNSTTLLMLVELMQFIVITQLQSLNNLFA